MPQDLRLSKEVQTYIDVLKNESYQGKSPEQRREGRKLDKMVEIMIDDIVKSRETITDNRAKGIEILVTSSPELIEDLLDDRFTVEAVDGVQASVTRLMRLSRLEAKRIPSKVTNGYLCEAVRTYIFGFAQASIALSRAALEQALKDRLERQGKGAHLLLSSHLIQEAYDYSYLDGAHRKWADEIAGAGDLVLHEKPATSDEAFDVLTKLRGVLAYVFTATGRLRDSALHSSATGGVGSE